MDYELARRLKKAGFRQGPLFDDSCSVPGGVRIQDRYFMSRSGSGAYVPTLPELVSACGDRFASVCRIVGEDLGLKYWRCEAFGVEESTVGSTAEEAVAEAWLRINAK